ncbi:unnamed protein product [Symbiodinium natans]|uniref:Uncharacterized protein n=1 Tax=Symbiodinium natans TaxID=878477 RepID=A0A812L575_9DINO|nr:unnamed protein product [Symbiodinium natans]
MRMQALLQGFPGFVMSLYFVRSIRSGGDGSGPDTAAEWPSPNFCQAGIGRCLESSIMSSLAKLKRIQDLRYEGEESAIKMCKSLRELLSAVACLQSNLVLAAGLNARFESVLQQRRRWF